MAELKMKQEILVKELAFFAKEGGVEPELIENLGGVGTMSGVGVGKAKWE